MGRAKVKMEYQPKEKQRNTTFKKRKDGLIRKLHEFTTLCDVDACMIIYGGPNPNEPEIWPKKPEQVDEIIKIFKNKGTGKKHYGVPDFISDRERKIVDDVAKLKRKNLLAKFPTKPDLLNNATEPQLREFHAMLSSKAQQVKSRLHLLKQCKVNNIVATTPSSSGGFYSPLLEAMTMNNHHPLSSGSSVKPEGGSTHVPLNMSLVDDKSSVYRGEMAAPAVNHMNSMSTMMLLMNRNDQLSSNIQLNHQIFLGSMDPVIPPPLQPSWYYPAPPHAQHYMLPPPPPPPPAQPQPYMKLHFSNPEHEDFIQYRIRNG